MKKIGIVLIIIDICACACFFLFYGPISNFRDWLVTTSMTTMTHKYLARTFYSDKMIENVLSKNYIEDFSESTNVDEVQIGNIKEIDSYTSIYEREILEHDGDEDFKIIEFDYNNSHVFLAVLYDPSRVSLGMTEYLGVQGQFLRDISKNNNALVAINAGGFSDEGGFGNGGSPTGTVIKDGKIIWSNGYYSGKLAGFNYDNILVLTSDSPNTAIENGMRDAIEFGPFLIVNGVEANISGNGGWGVNPRTALAQRKDGIVLFLVADGNGYNSDWSARGGLGLSDVMTILKRYGAYNAVNLDGGASTTLVVNNELYNNPCSGSSSTGEREVPNGWIFK